MTDSAWGVGAKASESDWMEEARMIAAQCWCDPETSSREMDADLANAVAKRIALWMETGARHANNEGYWRERAERAEAALADMKMQRDDLMSACTKP